MKSKAETMIKKSLDQISMIEGKIDAAIEKEADRLRILNERTAEAEAKAADLRAKAEAADDSEEKVNLMMETRKAEALAEEWQKMKQKGRQAVFTWEEYEAMKQAVMSALEDVTDAHTADMIEAVKQVLQIGAAEVETNRRGNAILERLQHKAMNNPENRNRSGSIGLRDEYRDTIVTDLYWTICGGYFTKTFIPEEIKDRGVRYF